MMISADSVERLPIQWLRYLLAVADHGGIAAAARALGVGQPTVTRTIRRLERSLDLVVLTRSRDGARLVHESEALITIVRRILNRISRARDEVVGVSAQGVGYVRVACGPAFTRSVMSETIARVLREFPQLQFEIQEGIADALFTGLTEGCYDAVFGTLPDRLTPRGVVFEPLLHLTPAIVGVTTHECLRTSPIQFARLEQQAWVSLDQSLSARMAEQLFAATGARLPQPIVTNSVEMLLSLVLSGRYLALWPRECVRREVRAGLLRAVRIPGPVSQPRAGLAYLTRRIPSHPVDRTLTLVRQICAERP